MNKFKEVAGLFGLELEEEFYIAGSDRVYKFNDDGVRAYSHILNDWTYDCTLEGLIKGDYEIIKKPWKPKKDDSYWYCHESEFHEFDVFESTWHDSTFDFMCWVNGNCFRTEEEAKTKGKEIVEKLKEEYENA